MYMDSPQLATYAHHRTNKHNVICSWCQHAHACCTQRLVSSRHSRLHTPGWSITQYTLSPQYKSSCHTTPAAALIVRMHMWRLGSFSAWVTLTMHSPHICFRTEHYAQLPRRLGPCSALLSLLAKRTYQVLHSRTSTSIRLVTRVNAVTHLSGPPEA